MARLMLQEQYVSEPSKNCVFTLVLKGHIAVATSDLNKKKGYQLDIIAR